MQTVHKVVKLAPRNCLPGWGLFLNLPSGDCWQGVQPDFTCSELTSRGLSAGGAANFTVIKPFSRGMLAGGVIDCLQG